MSWLRPDDTWGLTTLLLGGAATGIFLEQRYRWASAVSGGLIAMGVGLAAANLGIAPTESPVYDFVWSFLVPTAVPLLLFDADVRRIWRESGRALSAFHLSALGTLLGAVLATALLGHRLPEIAGLAAMFSATYIGGSVNYVAMSEAFGVSPPLRSAGIVADNLLMAAAFGALVAMPSFAWFRRRYPIPYEEKLAAGGGSRAAAYWSPKAISLRDLAGSLAIAVAIAALSAKLAAAVQASALPALARGLLGQKYLLASTFTVLLASAFPRFLGRLAGAKELGTLLMYVFFVVIGVPAAVGTVIRTSPLLLLYAGIIVVVNVVFTLVVGRWTRHPLEVLIVASNANLGGPTSAAAAAIGRGWGDLVLPAVLTGVWGYVIANYVGYYLGTVVRGIFAG